MPIYTYVPKSLLLGQYLFFECGGHFAFLAFFRLTDILGHNTFRKARSRSAGQEISHFFTEAANSLPCSQKQVTGEDSPYLTPPSSISVEYWTLIRTFELASSLLSFTIQILHAFSHLPMRSTCPAYLAILISSSC